MLFAAGLAAQQVLMAPTVDVSFDSVEVTGQADAVEVTYELAATDWAWTHDFGMDVWLGVYTSEATEQWQLQRVERLEEQQGEISVEGAADSGTDAVGICLIVASVDGGKLAPGLGYVCETPLVVSTADGRLDAQMNDASVALNFEQNIDQQPWYAAERGFGQAGAASDQVGAASNQRGDDQAGGEFFSYRAPSPREDARGADARRSSRHHQQRGHQRRGHQRRGHQGAPNHGMVILTPGYLPGFFADRHRADVDRFRQRRLERRRIFGPLDGFDAKFNQDMFQTHPGDVFYDTPIPPGYFGRDAFGRDLQHGFGVPAGLQRKLQHRGLGQPFD